MKFANPRTTMLLTEIHKDLIKEAEDQEDGTLEKMHLVAVIERIEQLLELAE